MHPETIRFLTSDNEDIWESSPCFNRILAIKHISFVILINAKSHQQRLAFLGGEKITGNSINFNKQNTAFGELIMCLYC